MPKPRSARWDKYNLTHKPGLTAEQREMLAQADWSGIRLGAGGYKDISVLGLTKVAAQIHNAPLMSQALAMAQGVRNELYRWIISYSEREAYKGSGFEQFKMHWRVFRVWCPLQVRLAAEEIFWELGPPYRKLVTGFRPLE